VIDSLGFPAIAASLLSGKLENQLPEHKVSYYLDGFISPEFGRKVVN
jgi:hypothetical protein